MSVTLVECPNVEWKKCQQRRCLRFYTDHGYQYLSIWENYIRLPPNETQLTFYDHLARTFPNIGEDIPRLSHDAMARRHPQTPGLHLHGADCAVCRDTWRPFSGGTTAANGGIPPHNDQIQVINLLGVIPGSGSSYLGSNRALGSDLSLKWVRMTPNGTYPGLFQVKFQKTFVL